MAQIAASSSFHATGGVKPRANHRKEWLLAFALLVIVFAVYWPGLDGELIVDDLPNLQPLSDLATGAIGWRDVVFGNESGPLGRPIAMATLVADLKIGGGSVYQFKLTNLVLHLLCTILVFSIALRLFTTYSRFRFANPARWALAVAAIWSLSPLFASTVLYVIQRMAQLSALFSLLGVLAYLIGRDRLPTRPGTGWLLIAVAYAVAWPAAVLSKENGVLLPALLFVIEAMWFEFRSDPKSRAPLIAVHTILFLVPAFCIAVWLLSSIERIESGYIGREFTLKERLLTETRALWDYIAQLFIPDGLRMGVVQDDYTISRSVWTPMTTLWSIVAWAVVTVVIVLARRVDAVRVLAFGVMFYWSGHLLESTILPLELYFEHRNYLPAVGLLIGVVGTLALIAERTARTPFLSMVLLVATTMYGFVTYQRVVIWQSAEAIARIAEAAHPRSPRLQTALISLYARDGDLAKARDHLKKLEELNGGRRVGHALHELEMFCRLKYVPTERDYEAIRRTTQMSFTVYDTERIVAFADMLQGSHCETVRLEELRDWLLQVSAQVQKSQDWITALHMARVFEMLGNPNEAIKLLDRADALDPVRLEPRLMKMRLMISSGELESAKQLLGELERQSRGAVKYQQEMIRKYREELFPSPVGDHN